MCTYQLSHPTVLTLQHIDFYMCWLTLTLFKPRKWGLGIAEGLKRFKRNDIFSPKFLKNISLYEFLELLFVLPLFLQASKDEENDFFVTESNEMTW